MGTTRRRFISGTTATTMALGAAGASPRSKITGIALSTIRGDFHKFVAMNSQDNEPKGTSYTNTLVRISTDAGIEGVGVMGYTLPDARFLADVKRLVGQDPESVYEFHDGQIASRAPAFKDLLVKYKHLDGPLCDLIGKLRGVPCWQLFGESVRDRVEVYDGTLYFSDLWFHERGVQPVIDEAKEAMSSGYLGIKLKIGRGSKWMDRDSGLQRDIEIVRAVRSAIGMEAKLLVDANNGYLNDFEAAWTFLEQTKEQRVDWLEEAFPEDKDLYRKLRGRMKDAGIKTPIADGENMRSAAQFREYIEPERLFDVAKTQKNIIGAEDDRSTCPALTVRGYEFKDGYYTVSNEPGLGVEVNQEFFEAPDFPGQTVIR